MDKFTTDKQHILNKLKLLGVARCVIAYSGGGDSGCVDSVVAYMVADPEEEIPLAGVHISEENKIVLHLADAVPGRKVTSLEQALDDFAYTALDHVGAGNWCDNEGGEGMLSIDVAKETIEIKHEVFETISNHESYIA